MQRIVILVVFIAIFSNLRTFKLLFGMISETVDIKNLKLMMMTSLLLDVCGFQATRSMVFVISGGGLCLFWGILAAKKHHLKEKKFDEIQFIDALIMQMRAGTSFENAFTDVLKTFFGKNGVFEPAGIASTYGQHAKLEEILKRCERNASQSFKILTSYRNFLRVRGRLRRKHAGLSVQAKAQAVVCAGLFFVILTAEWCMFPNFPQFLGHSWGRLTLVVAFSLLLIGEKAILALSKPRELNL